MASSGDEHGREDRTAAVGFVPAAHMPYECTIHTLSMRGDDDGRRYDVVLDLIRSDRNPAWGLGTDRTALRAAVVDAEARRVVASTFVEGPRADFARDVGELHIMDSSGRIGFRAAHADSPGVLELDLVATLWWSTLVQTGTDFLKAALERGMAGLSPARQEVLRGALALQLAVSDYPKTEHTGTLSFVPRAGERPRMLRAERTLSTLSHHYGNALTDYVFLASVPAVGRPSFIAVVTRDTIDLDSGAPGGELGFPVGYLIHTAADGKSAFSLLHPEALARDEDRSGAGASEDDRDRGGGGFEIGGGGLLGGLFGAHLEVHDAIEVGRLLLNDGRLPSRTGFAAVTLSRPRLLQALGLAAPVVFPEVVVDVTGAFLARTKFGAAVAEEP
jgi:hypothetical protein